MAGDDGDELLCVAWQHFPQSLVYYNISWKETVSHGSDEVDDVIGLLVVIFSLALD